MISVSGMSTMIALRIVDATREAQVEIVETQPQHARAIEAFRGRIDTIETVDQLLEDHELYVFVMKAFDLEDQIFGKAMMGKILKSDPDDRESLLNRLTNDRFRDMYDTMEFGPEGVGNTNVLSADWREAMVNRYVETQITGGFANQNENLGIALKFRNRAEGIENAFDLLKDRDMAKFIQRALGLPEEMSSLDVDKQAKMIEDRLDLTTLTDPEVMNDLVRRYAAISDALDTDPAEISPALAILRGQAATIDISIIPQLPATPYR